MTTPRQRSQPWADRSRRKTELPKDWYKIRAKVFKRDGRSCYWGSIPSDGAVLGSCRHTATDIDHVGDRHDHSLENLRPLCRSHHTTRTGRQGGAVSAEHRRRIIAQRNRPAEPHPGGR